MTPEQIAKARKLKADIEEAKRVRLYKEVFNSAAGQAVLADMARAHGLYERVFTLADRGDHSAYDPLKAALKDGGRDVIIRINSILSTPLHEETKKPKVIKK